jgi:hypothetical protein
MLLRPEYLSQKLDRPLPTKDGGTLHTLGEACDYMTNMGKKRELLSHWQRVAKFILAKRGKGLFDVEFASSGPRAFGPLIHVCPHFLNAIAPSPLCGLGHVT